MIYFTLKTMALLDYLFILPFGFNTPLPVSPGSVPGDNDTATMPCMDSNTHVLIYHTKTTAGNKDDI